MADIGCGVGWSSISIARAYPKVRVDGFDLDEDSIAEAKANAEAEGLADRVAFRVRDAADLELSAGTTWRSPSSASTTWADPWRP